MNHIQHILSAGIRCIISTALSFINVIPCLLSFSIYNLSIYLILSESGIFNASIACSADSFIVSIRFFILCNDVFSTASFLISSILLHIMSTPSGFSFKYLVRSANKLKFMSAAVNPPDAYVLLSSVLFHSPSIPSF